LCTEFFGIKWIHWLLRFDRHGWVHTFWRKKWILEWKERSSKWKYFKHKEKFSGDAL